MYRLGKKLLPLCLVLLVISMVLSPLSAAQAPVWVQLGFIIDGSRSMDSEDFRLMTSGIASALNDPSIVPRDGRVEVCVVQFGLADLDNQVRIEVAPTVITDANVAQIADDIRGIAQGLGETPTAQGIRLCTNVMISSPNFATAARRIMNIATDGVPYDHIQFPDDPHDAAVADALAASSEAQAAGIEELDAEVLGELGKREGQLDFFLNVVFPQPAVLVPPGEMDFGFVRLVEDLNDFDLAVYEKLALLIWPTPTPTLTPTHTVTPVATATAAPVPSATATPSPAPPTPEIPEGNSLLLLASGLAALSGYGGWLRIRRGRSSRDERDTSR